jgi:hypothetical protein
MTHEVPATAGRSAQVCEPEPPTAAAGCYGLRPQDLHSAYQLPTRAESPQTIAIVDPFNDPSAEADLKEYDREFGLPECTAQDGCFRQVNGKGEPGNLPSPNLPWDSEISLDIETAHAICQNCRILLVEAASSNYQNLEEAEQSAVRLGASEISDSWGRTEPATEGEAFNHPGVVITAAAGDEGFEDWGAPNPKERMSVRYPASSPHVVAVGGTRLGLEEGARQEETVWNSGSSNGSGHATGGGCSAVFAAPPWQLSTSGWPSVGCRQNRAVSDVSADADPYTGAAIYNSNGACETHPWCTLGGTSLASPIIAAVFALAGGAHGVEYPARTLYENELDSPGSLHDVLAGSNGECSAGPTPEGLAGCSTQAEAASCSQQASCLARVGYDGPSGVGTPNGLAAFEPFTAGPKESAPVAPAETSPGAAPIADPTQPATQAHGTPSMAALTIRVSGLALTPRAVAALDGERHSASQIAFTFSINAAARVRATLAKQIRVRGLERWKLLRDSLTIAATTGRNGRSLHVRGRLDPGIYRLTLTAARGTSQSVFFRIG